MKCAKNHKDQSSEPLNVLKWLTLHFKNPWNWVHVKSEWYKNHEIFTLWEKIRFFLVPIFYVKSSQETKIVIFQAVLQNWFHVKSDTGFFFNFPHFGVSIYDYVPEVVIDHVIYFLDGYTE